MKNKMMWKLVCCFGAALILFTIVTNSIFMVLFRRHIVDTHRDEMERQAEWVAGIYARIDLHGSLDHSKNLEEYLTLLDELISSDTWIAVENQELLTHGGYTWEDLPPEAKGVITRALAGEEVVSESFSDLLKTPVLSVAVPILGSGNKVVGAVLLHSPVDGMETAVFQGLWILGVSILTALFIAAVLSVCFSYRFTKPLEKIQAAARQLSDGNYEVKTQVTQHDEIGQLAGMIDLLADRLKAASLESQRLEHMRQDFVINVSHELRTPVTVLRGSLEAIKDGIVTEPEQIMLYHNQMLLEVLFLDRLINDMLELSRLQNVDFVIEMAPLNLSDLIKDVTRGMRRVAQQQNISIITDLASVELQMTGDYGRIRQMLIIVLDNAIKFSSPGQLVRVSLEAEGREGAALKITDYGCGIEPDELAHIFNRFYKKKSVNNKAGTGVGLTIANQIAKRHGITITIESDPGIKTEFVFHIKVLN